jgi:hypothetical protein
MTVDTASKEIVGTPSLKGQAKITNQSKDIMDIQVATLEYLDKAGKPIAFKSGEEIPKISVFVKALKPGESNEGSFDARIPGMAVKENARGQAVIRRQGRIYPVENRIGVTHDWVVGSEGATEGSWVVGSEGATEGSRQSMSRC